MSPSPTPARGTSDAVAAGDGRCGDAIDAIKARDNHGEPAAGEESEWRGGLPVATKAAQDCASLAQVREQIDALDAALMMILSERFSFVQRVCDFKSNAGQVRQPARIEEVISRIRTRARRRGFPPDIAENIWRHMIEQFIEYEEAVLRDDDKRAPATKA